MRHNKRSVARRPTFLSRVPSKPHSSCPLMAVSGGFRPAPVKFSGFSQDDPAAEADFLAGPASHPGVNSSGCCWGA